jgi:UDP-N-acetyl-D-galactosamine dehydrogenase
MPSFVPPTRCRIGVIGLGYVGLPLAVALGKVFDTLGFDLDPSRVAELREGRDSTGEVTEDEIGKAVSLRLTSSDTDLGTCNVFIVAVPTPIDSAQRPNLSPLIDASKTVGRVIRKGGVVIYESTVFPGATQEVCIPVIEEVSGLRFNVDFFAGYSPERINPGDKLRPLTKIVKLTSGSTPDVADFVDGLYGQIIEAGTYKTSSITVAEAAKIIENTQRDVNIALINELSIIFSHLGIDTTEVLDAAATKWNFIHLRPGLVGGHCIGVDPYYLLHKATSAGFIPDIIRTARELNNGMARNAVDRLVKAMVARDLPVKGAKVLVVGITFKQDCPDTRNTKVVDMLSHLRDWGMDADVVDTWADPEQVLNEFGLRIGTALPSRKAYDAVVFAVPHRDIVALGPGSLRDLLVPGGVFFDMMAAFERHDSDLRL